MRLACRSLLSVASFAVLSLAALPAFAQAEKAGQGTHYIEGTGTEIVSGRKGPFVVLVIRAEKPRFPKLLQLKKSLRPAMLATGSDLKLK